MFFTIQNNKANTGTSLLLHQRLNSFDLNTTVILTNDRPYFVDNIPHLVYEEVKTPAYSFYLQRMQSFVQRVLAALSSRLARNIYFWIWMLSSRMDYKFTQPELFFTGIIFLLFAVLFYGNNLFLVPRYLPQKKSKTYILLYSLLVLGVSLAYLTTYKTMLHYFPDTHVWKISPLVFSNENADWSFPQVLTELREYYLYLFFSGLIFAMSWFVMDYQRQQKLMEAGRKKHIEMELNFLRSQLNPHFLFNTLNNLYTLTLKKADSAPGVVSKLSIILRYLLYESNTGPVSFEKEKEIMKAYIDLELLRLPDNSKMHFTINADRPYSLPPLLWMPLLENVFKHGTRYISDSHEVEFTFSIKENRLSISSRNNYKMNGTEVHDADNAGIGLANFRKRLDLLYPDAYAIDVTHLNGMHSAHVNINLLP